MIRCHSQDLAFLSQVSGTITTAFTRIRTFVRLSRKTTQCFIQYVISKVDRLANNLHTTAVHLSREEKKKLNGRSFFHMTRTI